MPAAPAGTLVQQPTQRVESSTLSVPNLTSVRTGCLYVNPGSRYGRRVYMCQMLILSFIPIAALILQNCTIMAEVSTAFNSALFLKKEIEVTFSVGDAVNALQTERIMTAHLMYHAEERKNISEIFLATDKSLEALSPTIKNSKNLTYIKSYKQDESKATKFEEYSSSIMDWYHQVNSEFLRILSQRIKETVASSLWRKLSVCYELLRSTEDFSVSGVIGLMYFKRGQLSLNDYFLYIHHDTLAEDHFLTAKMLLMTETNVAQFVDLDVCNTRIESRNVVVKNAKSTINSSMNFLEYMQSTKWCIEAIGRQLDKQWVIVRYSIEKEIWKSRRTLCIAIAVLVVVVVVAPVIILLVRSTVNTIQTFTRTLELSTQELRAEKMKSDQLLSRMLPLAVVRQLRAERTVPAESFDAVTIYFSDIIGFTMISAASTAMEVIIMLNALYKLFDARISMYDVYKVETIGDAYMVASGLPQRNGDKHASEIANMSLDLLMDLENFRIPHRPAEKVKIRVGLNTGPCVAGVVGTTMPRYCLFGDTINTASRMESCGEAMRIHISNSTKLALDKLGGYEIVYRGKLDVRGKGDMETHWLVSKVGRVYQSLQVDPIALVSQPHFIEML